MSCRSKVTKHLCKQYETLSQAEDDLEIDYVFTDDILRDSKESTPISKSQTISHLESLSPIFQCSPVGQTSSNIGDSVQNLLKSFKCAMSAGLKKQLINDLFKLYIIDIWGNEFCSFVEHDFLEISLNAMNTLKRANKFNLVLLLSKCFFTSNQDSQPRMPLDRMPFGLIDYNIRFFACNAIQSVHAEKHYTSWIETMFSHFGHKWLSLFRGPAWHYETQPGMESSGEPIPLLDTSKVSSNSPCGTPSTSNASVLEPAAQTCESSPVSDETSMSSPSIMPVETPSTTSIIEHAILDSGIQADITDEMHLYLCNSNGNEQSNSEGANLIQMALESSGINLLHLPVACKSKRRSSVSHLWTQLTLSETEEIMDGNVSPRQMEHHHHIAPNACTRRSCNSGLYDPMKVYVKKSEYVYKNNEFCFSIKVERN